ncbi:MAG: DUF6614 family protein [Pseudomonadota bacterium]
MIYMLSRFDLKPETDFQSFQKSYARFFEHIKSVGLAETAGKICARVHNTPMDTDEEDAPEYYAIMTFRDRDQLDEAYRYMATGNAHPAHLESHETINKAITNQVFTCWQDED